MPTVYALQEYLRHLIKPMGTGTPRLIITRVIFNRIAYLTCWMLDGMMNIGGYRREDREVSAKSWWGSLGQQHLTLYGRFNQDPRDCGWVRRFPSLCSLYGNSLTFVLDMETFPSLCSLLGSLFYLYPFLCHDLFLYFQNILKHVQTWSVHLVCV